jgi:hypothetical protein
LKITIRQGLTALGIVGLVACGSQSNYPVKPVLFVTPGAYDYLGDGGVPGTDTDPALAAYVGTSQTFSIQIEDRGQDPLTISKVTLSDPMGGFTLVQPSPAGPDGGLQSTINSFPQFPAEAFVAFYFTPTAVQTYTASITITTNGSNDGGVAIIPIRALGVTADAGQFNFDGG